MIAGPALSTISVTGRARMAGRRSRSEVAVTRNEPMAAMPTEECARRPGVRTAVEKSATVAAG